MPPTGYDIVGDIHGHADALHRLLRALGYSEADGVFRHPERQMLFVGDFIDRGPMQREVLRIVQSMCDVGAARAVMGNHEYNAIGWVTQGDDGYLRERSEKNRKQHAEFLGQFVADSPDHQNAVEWFRKLPVFLELPGLRLVHACWHGPSLRALLPYLNRRRQFTDAGLRESFRKGSAAANAVDVLLKGPEHALPEGLSFFDKDGHERKEVRLRWWDGSATTFRRAALGMEGREHKLPDTELPVSYGYADLKPVFFGHYWLPDDTPRLTSPAAACLDFSVARGGHLTAYRWSGDGRLRDEDLVFVKA